MQYNPNPYIPHPSDPRNIKITSVTISLPTLADKLQYNEINYRYKEYPWGNEKMSRLIEAILLRIPLPVFYFDVSRPHDWICIEEVARLETIHKFMNNDLLLTNMEILTHLNDLNYSNLNNTYKRILHDTQIITYQVEGQTPPALREIIFKKIRDINAN